MANSFFDGGSCDQTASVLEWLFMPAEGTTCIDAGSGLWVIFPLIICFALLATALQWMVKRLFFGRSGKRSREASKPDGPYL